MPAKHGLELDQDERFHPARPEPPQRDPEEAVKVVEAGSRMLALECGKLLAQGENLETKVMARANERAQVGEECEHAADRIVEEKQARPSEEFGHGRCDSGDCSLGILQQIDHPFRSGSERRMLTVFRGESSAQQAALDLGQRHKAL